jgi:hypothetical protein
MEPPAGQSSYRTDVTPRSLTVAATLRCIHNDWWFPVPTLLSTRPTLPSRRTPSIDRNMPPLRSHAWRFCGLHGCPDESRVAVLKDRSQARVWLQPFKADASRIAAMRTLLSRDGSRHVARMSNDGVIDAIGELLARGRLHVHEVPVGNLPTATIAPVETVHVPFPFADRQPRQSTSMLRIAGASDEPTFLSDVDLARQAGTLVAAAAQGAPFCRMCAKPS